MSNFLEVVVLVEGQTEQKFVNDVLAPYMVVKGIYMTPIIISKKGQKGGDVKFQRVKTDICNHLKQRNSGSKFGFAHFLWNFNVCGVKLPVTVRL